MENQNKTVTVEVEVIRGIADDIKTLLQKMPGTASLTPEQKAERPRIPVSVTDLRIFKSRLASAQQNRAQLPGTFDLAKLESDAGQMVALFEVLGALSTFSDRVKDTLWLLSSSVLPSAATASAYIKIALKQGQKMQGPERRRRRRTASVAAPPVQGPSALAALPADPVQKAA